MHRQEPSPVVVQPDPVLTVLLGNAVIPELGFSPIRCDRCLIRPGKATNTICQRRDGVMNWITCNIGVAFVQGGFSRSTVFASSVAARGSHEFGYPTSLLRQLHSRLARF